MLQSGVRLHAEDPAMLTRVAQVVMIEVQPDIKDHDGGKDECRQSEKKPGKSDGKIGDRPEDGAWKPVHDLPGGDHIFQTVNRKRLAGDHAKRSGDQKPTGPGQKTADDRIGREANDVAEFVSAQKKERQADEQRAGGDRGQHGQAYLVRVSPGHLVDDQSCHQRDDWRHAILRNGNRARVGTEDRHEHAHDHGCQQHQVGSIADKITEGIDKDEGDKGDAENDRHHRHN